MNSESFNSPAERGKYPTKVRPEHVADGFAAAAAYNERAYGNAFDCITTIIAAARGKHSLTDMNRAQWRSQFLAVAEPTKNHPREFIEREFDYAAKLPPGNYPRGGGGRTTSRKTSAREMARSERRAFAAAETRKPAETESEMSERVLGVGGEAAERFADKLQERGAGGIWTYRWADGKTTGAVCRAANGAKGKWHCRPDADGNVIWKGPESGKIIPLYRLPELIAAKKAGAKCAIITEGESSADAMAAIFEGPGKTLKSKDGLELECAVTSFAGGAGGKRGSSLRDRTDKTALSGFDLIVAWGDRDEAGRTFAGRVAEEIIRDVDGANGENVFAVSPPGDTNLDARDVLETLCEGDADDARKMLREEFAAHGDVVDFTEAETERDERLKLDPNSIGDIAAALMRELEFERREGEFVEDQDQNRNVAGFVFRRKGTDAAWKSISDTTKETADDFGHELRGLGYWKWDTRIDVRENSDGEIKPLRAAEMVDFCAADHIWRGVITDIEGALAKMNLPVQPALQARVMESLPEWDGVDRLGNLDDQENNILTSCFDVEINSLTPKLIKWFFRSIAARAVGAPKQPILRGIKAELSLWINGDTGCGKDSWWDAMFLFAEKKFGVGIARELCPLVSFDDHERVWFSKARTAMVMNVSEGVGINKMEQSAFRARMSDVFDSRPLLYKTGKALKRIRRHVTGGSLNPGDYLPGSQGARRRWGLINVWKREDRDGKNVSEFVTETLSGLAEQAFAQALAEVRAGKAWYPDDEWTQKMVTENARSAKRDAGANVIVKEFLGAMRADSALGMDDVAEALKCDGDGMDIHELVQAVMEYMDLIKRQDHGGNEELKRALQLAGRDAPKRFEDAMRNYFATLSVDAWFRLKERRVRVLVGGEEYRPRRFMFKYGPNGEKRKQRTGRPPASPAKSKTETAAAEIKPAAEVPAETETKINSPGKNSALSGNAAGAAEAEPKRVERNVAAENDEHPDPNFFDEFGGDSFN